MRPRIGDEVTVTLRGARVRSFGRRTGTPEWIEVDYRGSRVSFVGADIEVTTPRPLAVGDTVESVEQLDTRPDGTILSRPLAGLAVQKQGGEWRVMFGDHVTPTHPDNIVRWGDAVVRHIGDAS